MMLRIAIVDDEKNILQYISDKIKKSIEKLSVNAQIESFSDSKELIRKFQNECFDIIFLDLEMPELDGLQTAEIIRKDYPNVIIAIVTNRDDLVFSTFQYDVSAFIRKKYFNEEIDSVIERIYNKVKNKASKYILKTEKGELLFHSDDIVYIESENHNIYLHEKSGNKIKIFYTLEKLNEIVSSEVFIRCHSGIIVNFNYIYSINKENISLTNNTFVPLSRNRKKEVKQGFQRYMRDL